MRLPTRPFRLPVVDIKEIKRIADDLKISQTAAYQIWKRKNRIGAEYEWKPV